MSKEGILDKKPVRLIITFLFMGIFFFTNVVDSSNVVNLTSDIKDYFIEATKGNIAGTETLNKFGENTNVGTTLEDIQSFGGSLTFLNSAEKMNITSTDTDDTIAGAGARVVQVIGLDGDFKQIEEMVNLSGTNVVQTTNEYIRVFRMYVIEVGFYGGVNEGTINAVADLNGSTQAQIVTGIGQSQTTHYTVPDGKRAIIKIVSITMDTGKVVDVEFIIREHANNTSGPFTSHRHLQHWHGLDAPISMESFADKNFDEHTDIWFETKVTSGSAVVEVNYDVILYDK